MSINEIEKRILEEAEAEALKIKTEAEASHKKMEKAHLDKIEENKSAILKAARQEAEAVKTALLVPARLKARKALLSEKQRIIGEIYATVQKEKKLSGAEINKVREASEVKAGQILFGDQL